MKVMYTFGMHRAYTVEIKNSCSGYGILVWVKSWWLTSELRRVIAICIATRHPYAACLFSSDACSRYYGLKYTTMKCLRNLSAYSKMDDRATSPMDIEYLETTIIFFLGGKGVIFRFMGIEKPPFLGWVLNYPINKRDWLQLN